MKTFNLIAFDFGYSQDQTDIQALRYEEDASGNAVAVMVPMTGGQGYQVTEDGNEVGLYSLAGVKLTLKLGTYGYQFQQPDAPVPAWASAVFPE